VCIWFCREATEVDEFDVVVLGTGAAFVVPADPEKPPPREELREIVRIELADYTAPDRPEILDRRPAGAMMKVDKNALRALASTSAGTSTRQAGGAA
jgi:non-ribosomal peptide synthetase component E (peptide arylation enzyme)